jgi:hypothetical protein
MEMNFEMVTARWKRGAYYLVWIAGNRLLGDGSYIWRIFRARFWRFWVGAHPADIPFMLGVGGQRKSVSLEITGLGKLSPHQEPVGIVRIACLEGFTFGHDAVLAAMNASGLEAFTAALSRAREQGVSRLDTEGRVHTFRLEAGAADVELSDDDDDRVEWRLSPETIDEMIDKLAGMRDNGPCHNYIDISTPAETLVLSLDEYFEPSAVVHTSPFGYF